VADMSFCQCTRELLQEYYVNLVRTHSSGQYTLEEVQPTITSPGSENSRSCSASPVIAPMEGQRMETTHHEHHPLVIAEPSSVLMGKTVSPPSSPPAQTGPTALEQNMAFAALQVALSPCVENSILRPEKRTSGHLIDQTDVDNVRPVKRKLGA
jgi:hypothetical protein